jgi:hypothetical protein
LQQAVAAFRGVWHIDQDFVRFPQQTWGNRGEAFTGEFVQNLLQRKFSEAYEMLSDGLKTTIQVSALEQAFDAMIGTYSDWYDDGVVVIKGSELGSTMTDWPDKQANDIGWNYVHIFGEGWTEAVTVVVEQVDSGRLSIRELKLGRP